ncbi:MAG: FtsX-like permease family protein [Bacteroidota bacterium]
MIRHLFKMIWNQKGKHLGLSFEILFSFLVLFAVFSFGMSSYQKYAQPMGFESDNIWLINLHWQDTSLQGVEQIKRAFADQLQAAPEVLDFSFSNPNIPFTNSTFRNKVRKDNYDLDSDIFTVDDRFAQVMSIQPVEGRWFGPEDNGSTLPPLVITASIAQHFFGSNAEAINQQLEYDGQQHRIIGVISTYRYRGDFAEAANSTFRRSNFDPSSSKILCKMRPGTTADFEQTTLRKFKEIAPTWGADVSDLSAMRSAKTRSHLTPLVVLGIICTFLMINVALGLFGVLWQSINYRKEEIGVRRAMGSTQSNVISQLIGEMLVLATFSLAIGLFFAVQFPIMRVFGMGAEVYVPAMLLATLIIYLVVVICAFFPSNQASRIPVVEALRHE